MILFPFELTKDNQQAFNFAVRIAEKTNKEVVLLNAFQIDNDKRLNNEDCLKLNRMKWQNAFSEVVALKDNYLTIFPEMENGFSTKFNHRFVQGTLIREINKVVKKENISLIVLSVSKQESHNRKLIDLFFRKIKSEHQVQILIVPEKSESNEVNEIGFAVDFNKINHPLQAIDFVHELSELFCSNLHLIHVVEKESEGKVLDNVVVEKINSLTKTNKFNKFRSLSGRENIHFLEQYLGINKIDLLVLVNGNKGFFGRIFNPDVYDKLMVPFCFPILIADSDHNIRW